VTSQDGLISKELVSSLVSQPVSQSVVDSRQGAILLHGGWTKGSLPWPEELAP
jgi:hypothetical protein